MIVIADWLKRPVTLVILVVKVTTAFKGLNIPRFSEPQSWRQDYDFVQSTHLTNAEAEAHCFRKNLDSQSDPACVSSLISSLSHSYRLILEISNCMKSLFSMALTSCSLSAAVLSPVVFFWGAFLVCPRIYLHPPPLIAIGITVGHHCNTFRAVL